MRDHAGLGGEGERRGRCEQTGSPLRDAEDQTMSGASAFSVPMLPTDAQAQAGPGGADSKSLPRRVRATR